MWNLVTKSYLGMWKMCKLKGLIMRQKNENYSKLCTIKMKNMQNHCEFVLTQQPTNSFPLGKVEYCGLKNQGNHIHSKIKKKINSWAPQPTQINEVYTFLTDSVELCAYNARNALCCIRCQIMPYYAYQKHILGCRNIYKKYFFPSFWTIL